MVNLGEEPQDHARRLTSDFAAWLDGPPVPEPNFYRSGLIVLDTNVLLDLYRVNPDTRSQVITALSSFGDRLWVPHQAAIEFSRNRKQVVIERQMMFKRVRESLRDSAEKAVDTLELAVDSFMKLRTRNGENSRWDLAAVGLDRDSLQQRLAGVMEPAIAELDAMQNAHDLQPGDMQATDEVLKQVDQLLAGRIGPAFSAVRLRELVEEAVTYRFPNQIPPGGGDAQKETALRAAGDFLLWRQTVDHANTLPQSNRLVLLITNEEKPDWWELDKRRQPVRPRPELVQEMRDYANAHIRLTSLANFLKSARSHWTPGISEQAIDELRRAASAANEEPPQGSPDISGMKLLNSWLSALSPYEFEIQVFNLLKAMGYRVEPSDSPDAGADALIYGVGAFGSGSFLVEVRLYRRPVATSAIYALFGVMSSRNIPGGVFISTGSFSDLSRDFAHRHRIQLVDGNDLARLLAEYSGLGAQVSNPSDD